MNNQRITDLGTAITDWLIRKNLPFSESLIKSTLFRHFCGGETLEESKQCIEELAAFGIDTILDYSVEGENDEAAFEAACQKIEETIALSIESENIPFAVFKTTGIARFELLEKISANQTLSEDEVKALNRVKQRFTKLCQKAFDCRVPVMIDAEESWIQKAIDDLVYEAMQKFNRDKAVIYNTIQLYRKDRLSYLQQLFEKTKNDGLFLGVKLVRGAYMERERERAAQFGYPSPIHDTKEETDLAFDEALRFVMNNTDRIKICCGTHNEKSNLLLSELIEKSKTIELKDEIYFSQLYGMGDHISYNLAKSGFKVAKYVPYGPVKSVLPYLFRRAKENTAMAGHVSRELHLILSEEKRRKEI
ncbi:MAG: proline dehydrogenase family protein [Chloroherpetonaceae bacterium]|nr:proline dehydrogenase family protein [Chloroherpetonaceae bacterium]